MALVVEDGTGLENAESYVSVADADTYFAERDNPASWSGASTAVKESALRYATTWIDSRYTWRGTVVSLDQALDWPRYDAYDDEGRLLEDVPVKLAQATAQAALAHIDDGLDVSLERGGLIKREKAGPLEVEYMSGAPGSFVYRFIDQILGGLALGSVGGGLSTARLVRA